MATKLSITGTSQEPGAVIVHCKDSEERKYELSLQSAEAAMLASQFMDAIQTWRGDPARPVLVMPVVRATIGRVEIDQKTMALLRIYVTDTNYHDYAIDQRSPSAKILLAMVDDGKKT